MAVSTGNGRTKDDTSLEIARLKKPIQRQNYANDVEKSRMKTSLLFRARSIFKLLPFTPRESQLIKALKRRLSRK